MICAVCGAKVETVTHHFHTGDPRRPSERWTIEAPQYFAATPDHRRMVVGFCGAACSLVWHRQNQIEIKAR